MHRKPTFLQRVWHFMCTVPLVPAYTVLAIIFILSMVALFVPMVIRQQVTAAITATATAMAPRPTPTPTPVFALVLPFPTGPVPTPLVEGQQGGLTPPSALTQVPAGPSPSASGGATQPTQTPVTQPTPTPQVTFDFNSVGGTLVTNPPTDWCITHPCVTTFWTDTNGYLVQCTDGKYSHSGGQPGVCSRNGGPAHIVYAHTA